MSELQKIIMSILSKGESSGYGITRSLKNKTRHSHQQVYRDLNKLLSEGLVEFKFIPQDHKPDKKLYKLTELGVEKHKSMLADPISVTDFSKINLVCAISSKDGYEELSACLKHYRNAQKERLEEVDTSTPEGVVISRLMKAEIEAVDFLLTTNQ